MNVSSIIAHIEQTAPLSIAAGWDHSGIQTPCWRTDISHLAVCLDPHPESIQKALELGADMILSHHPLTLSPRFTDKMDNYTRALHLLFRADVPLYSAHTSLDANPRGPSGWLARELGLTDVSILEPTGTLEDPVTGDLFECGFGLVGNVASPRSIDEILALIYPAAPRLAGLRDTSCRPSRVAICPGSGGSLANAAASAGAELFITGDIKYHDALDMPLPVLDVGHFSLEERMMQLFAQKLQTELAKICCSFIPSEDPFMPCQPLS